MKKWAFYKDGEEWHRIGVYAALAKEKEEPGLWRRRTYYSTHSDASVRLRMNIRKSPKGQYLFAYNPGQDTRIERLGGGESLAHYLYKVAISELKNTTLKISNLKKDIRVQFIEAETEKRVYIDDRYYDLDVFVKFKSSSEYQLKWGGELGIEVHNTNPVIGQKLRDLKELRVPVIEIGVNKNLAYKTVEEYSTPESERDYIEFLKGRLTDHLWGKVLSDPKSVEYLEKENSYLIDLVGQLKEKLANSEIHLKQAKLSLEKSEQRIKQQGALLIEKDSFSNDLEVQLKRHRNMGVFSFFWYKLTNK
ncbi:MAG: hypothetical protein JAY90_03775 [Candidatus Thiodiazotropha lotti]|nr:hypothetical protein [Candidatus Thiodiazotropha lotti]